MTTPPPHHPGTIEENIADLLMEMDLPLAVHAMVPQYIDIKTYRVERETLTFRGSFDGAQVECVVSARHGRPTVTISITD